MPELPEVSVKFSTIKSPKKVSENDCKDLEKFFIFLCFLIMNVENINYALRVLFTQGGGFFPTTAAALKEHVLGTSLQYYMCLECFRKTWTEWGWHKVESLFVSV